VRATDATGSDFAVKVIPLCSESVKCAALHEAAVHSSLSHPNIIKFIDSFERAGSMLLVMERANGPTLDSVLHSSSRRMEEHQILELFIQILSAVEYLHRKRIVHRDLKSGNVFMTDRKTAKLGDFGCAEVLPESGFLNSGSIPVGTPGFIAPEVVEGNPSSFAADIFSLGCILLEMCTLQRPSDSYSRAVRNLWDPLPKQYTVGLEDLIKLMLSPDSKRRPSISEIWKLPVVRCACNRPLNVDFLLVDRPDSTPESPIRSHSCEELWKRTFGSPNRDAIVPSSIPGLREEIQKTIGGKAFDRLRYHLENEFDDFDSADYIRELSEQNDYGLKLVRELILLEQ
jgi:NIMA (never in mitosis gene a)-related kinase